MNQNIVVQQNIPIPVEIVVSGNIATDNKQSVSGSIVIGSGYHQTYTGEYIVTPTVAGQTLETQNKLMTDDVTVEAIPYHEVSNLFNGLTITIGG